MNQGPLDYLDYLCLPNDERSRYGVPLLSIFWTDRDRLAGLRRKTWFSALREQLNAQGTVKIKFPFFEYTPRGEAVPLSAEQAEELACDLLARSEPLSCEALQCELEKALSQPIFRPFSVTLDGVLRMAFNDRDIVAVLQEYLKATRLLQPLPQFHLEEPGITEQDIGHYKRELTTIAVRLLGPSGFTELVTARLFARQGFGKVTYHSSEYFLAVIEAKPNRAAEPVICHVMCPPDAVDMFPSRAGFGARLIGWICHVGGEHFALLPLAMAQVLVVRHHH